MANYNAIKTATNAYIRSNGRQEITGNILNAVLIATIDALGKYFQFAGVADRDTDPGTPDENVIYITGEAGTYTNFGGIVVNAGEMALLVWNGQWRKQVIKIVPEYTSQLQNDSGFINNAVGNLLNYYNKSETYTKGQVDDLIAAVHQFEFVVADELPDASADTMYKIYLIPADGADTDNVKDEYVTIEEEGVYSWEMIGTTAVDLSDYPTNEQMAQAIDDALAAYISSINASVDANVGTPSVDVTYSSGVLTLAFHNLKGQTGEQGVPGPAGVTSANVTVDNNTGIPSVEATLNAGVLTLTFHNLKGAQGDTGSSVAYPFTLVNNTTTDDPLQALTAAMGKYLQDQITQLEHEVTNLSGRFYGVFDDEEDLPEGDANGYAFVGDSEPMLLYVFIGGEWANTGIYISGIVGPPGEPGEQGIQGIQGPVGVTSVVVTVDTGTGIPSVDASISSGVLTISFHNLKGVQGDTGSSVAYAYTLVNNLTSGGTDKALTAEMGKYLYDFIIGGTVAQPVSTSGYTPLGYFINNLNKWNHPSGSLADSIAIPLTDIHNLTIAVSGGNAYAAFLKSLDNLSDGGVPDFATGYNGRIQFTDGTTIAYNDLSDANYLYLQSKSSGGDDLLPRYSITTIVPVSGAVLRSDIVDSLQSSSATAPLSAKQGLVLKGMIFPNKTIYPELEIGALTNLGIDNTTAFYGKKYWRMSRFAKMSEIDTITADVDTDGTNIRFSYYDEDFDFIGYHDVTAAASVTDTPPSGAVYLRVGVDSARPSSSAFEIPRPLLSLTGKFAEMWDVPMNRPSSGSLSILVPVMVSDPNTDEAETANLQDTQTLLSDTGVLALPETYEPNGTPTRLIIYCHGAGVNYAIGTGAFPSTDLQPEYWLAEGYAVMDIEGNPYNDTDEHFFIPAARQSYIAAYEFVTRKYNIKKDGILLGGRSMGGGMVFDLLLSRIPVIAACPVVPAINEIWCWEYMSASRRQFAAQKMGFTGTAPTWTSDSPMTSAEWQYLQDNFDKFIKYSPFFALMPDTPNKTEIFSVGNIGKSIDNADEAALYATRRFKTKAPVKMFAVHDDATVNNSRNCDLVHRMMLNAAQIVEMRYFATGGHHFELTSPYLLASYTTQYGETLTDVPVVYVEMLAFWRRYEQGL